jgi:GTP-binding protein Era
MKVGFVAIIGRPNVGKSSLINKILNYKISITSKKPQTTRNQIKGIYNDNDSQIIFIDTPGIHKPKQILGKYLNYSSFLSFQDVDIILFLTPIDELIGPGDKMIIEKIKNFNKIAVITKLDKSNAKNAEKKAIKLKKLGFKIILGTSINIDNSIKEIINFLKKNLPKGKPFYETNEITDKSINFIIKELIRESIIKRVKDELPHSIAVLIEEFLEPSKKTNNYYLIKAFLYVERKSQKGILIGKNGNMIKSIGIESRKKIKNLLNHKIYLDLKVKIKKN